MSMFRTRWSLAAALGTLLLVPTAYSVSSVRRTVLVEDPAFRLPDSVRASLTGVTRLVVAPDSTLYMADWQIPAILHLEPNGSLRDFVGRSGAGPGEFYQVLALGLYRDSLWAMDPAQVRVTMFDLASLGVKTLPYGPYAPRSNTPGIYTRRGMPASILPDGSLLLEENTPDPTRPTTGQLLRVDRNMRVLDTIAPLPAEHSRLSFYLRDGNEIHSNQPFGDDPLYGVSVDGALVVVVNRRVATGGDEGEFTVTAYRDGKQELYSRRLTYQPRRISNRVVDSVVAALAGYKLQGSSRPSLTTDSVLNHLYRPIFYPPVSAVRVGRDGGIWLNVEFADSPAATDEWLQLSPRGLPIRRVQTPDRFRLLEADHHNVWGTFTDSLEVPQVRRYTLDRPSQD